MAERRAFPESRDFCCKSGRQPEDKIFRKKKKSKVRFRQLGLDLWLFGKAQTNLVQKKISRFFARRFLMISFSDSIGNKSERFKKALSLMSGVSLRGLVSSHVTAC